ncbi:hypothetical protein [Arthrobacter glacialis]|uniref:hypothetical protein n=1 Tax=Arthrobacter glacialis TaxID=1664 RepID=UPI000CD485C0|nr:hypothetical protein [Arthrobacter glacialis]POH58915.1 hypothetical protein CVS28_09410 [Arthrobacter glacialis]
MGDIYVAKANVVKVAVGAADGNRVARIIRKGGTIPEGVEQEALEALAERGLIELVTPAAAPEVAEAEQAAAVTAAKAAAEQAAATAAAKAVADAAAATEKKTTGK